MAISVTKAADQPGGREDSGPATVISVFLLDDHEIIRRGVRDLLEAQPDIRVTGEAETAASALPRIRATRPDVALLDVRLDDGDGVTVCRDIRSELPDVACLMLTSYDDDQAMIDATMAGAVGYVLKHIEGTDLVSAVRTAAAGQSLLTPGTIDHVMARLRGEPDEHGPLEALTQQERRVFDLIGEGLTNRQIGEHMFLSEKTVKNYVSSVFVKLGLERRTQIAAYAVRRTTRDPRRGH
jgi:DNA-binding NarL/FixJ family response regulator